MAIKKNFIVEKRNVLNEIRSNSMTLQELRFFSIYLAKINARDKSTRVVRFSMAEFQKIMEFGKLNMGQLQNTADSLLSKVVGVTLENGNHVRFQLFKKTIFSQDESGEWHIEIDAHDDALPLMFEFKERYFKYELWNALRLKSANQLRMYEILKQYENLGIRIISIVELKEFLGLDIKDYPRYNNFRACVLDVCQEALEKYTDIKFTYEPTGKLGRGSKVYNLKFTILHNENYIDPLLLDDFIDVVDAQFGGYDKPNKPDDTITTEFVHENEHNEHLDFLAEACKNEFTESEIRILRDIIVQVLPYKVGGSAGDFQMRVFDHLKHRYDELLWRAERTDIKNRFSYLRKILEADLKEKNEKE